MLDQRARPGRRGNTERERKGDRAAEGGQTKLRRSRETGQQFAQYRLPGSQRSSEIAVRELSEIIKKLRREAAVEPHLVPDLLDCLLGGCYTGEIDGRVAGESSGQQEGHDDDAGNARQSSDEAAHYKHHWRARPACRGDR